MMKSNRHFMFWDMYSERMHEDIQSFEHAGFCGDKEYGGVKLGVSYGMSIELSEDGKIVSDFLYGVKGPTFMIAMLESLSRMVIGSKVNLLFGVSVDRILEGMRVYDVVDIYKEVEVSEYVNFLMPYVEDIVESFMDLIKNSGISYYETPEGLKDFSVEGEGVRGFLELTKEGKVGCIEDVIEKDIRPYVELDEGGVRVKDITKSGVVLIEYEGSCTTCHAASSTTLSAIRSILKAKVHESIEVLPYIVSSES